MQGAKRALGRLDGVRRVEAVPGTLRVRIVPSGDRTLDLAAIGPLLWDQGIRALEIRIVAVGAREGGRFRIRGWPEAWPIEGEPRGDVLHAAVTFVDGAPRLRVL